MSDYSPSISFSLADGFIYVDYDSKKWRIAAYEISSFCAQVVEHLVKDFPSATDAEKKSLREKCVGFFNTHSEEIKKTKPKEKQEERSGPEKGDDSKALVFKIADALQSFFHFVSLKDTEELFVWVDPKNEIVKSYSVKEVGIYVPAEPFVKHYCEVFGNEQGILKEITTHVCNEVLNHLRRLFFEDRSIFQPGNPHLVLEDCLFNLKTFLENPDAQPVEEFNPNYHSLSKIHTSYKKDADCPKFKKFLSEIQTEDNILSIQEQLGACFSQNYDTKRFAMWQGEGGTGKTTLVSVFEALLGKQNISSLSLEQLTDPDSFLIHGLFGKFANIRDDIPANAIKSIGQLKQLTGNSPMDCDIKYAQNPIHFTNTAFIIFTMNVFPDFLEADDALYERILINVFGKKYGGNGTPNRRLLSELTTPEELSGILNWGLEGLKRLHDRGGGFNATMDAEQTRSFYEALSDPTKAWVKDRIDEDLGAECSRDELWFDFKQYCADRKLHLPSDQLFYKRLRRLVRIENCRIGEKGRQKFGYRGIKLKEKTEANQTLSVGQNETFIHLRPDELGFGSDCEYCGRSSVATYKSSERRFACKECATSS